MGEAGGDRAGSADRSLRETPGPTLADARAAAVRLRGVVLPTSLIPAPSLGEMIGSPLWLKPETLQRTGSFKLRGAYNCLALLRAEARGVAAASAGNHAQGVALAAQLLGRRATVVMPETASLPKIAATRGYGAEVVLRGTTYDDAYEHARALAEERGLTFVHPFDDPLVVAGQATVGLEILGELADPEVVVVPVGGGGLIAGIGLVCRALCPRARVVGVAAARAPGIYESWRAGAVTGGTATQTLADGLAVKRPTPESLRRLLHVVDDMVTVQEDDIAWAMVLLLERARLVAEGAGAAALAALLSGRIPAARGRRTVAVVSGGNVDVAVLGRVIGRGLARAGRHVTVSTRVVDRPGALARLLALVGSAGANVLAVEHKRLRGAVPLGETAVEVQVETRDRAHVEQLLELLRAEGYAVETADGD